jgi:multisubunit Na+/H+ antiporter MnhB subunit
MRTLTAWLICIGIFAAGGGFAEIFAVAAALWIVGLIFERQEAVPKPRPDEEPEEDDGPRGELIDLATFRGRRNR